MFWPRPPTTWGNMGSKFSFGTASSLRIGAPSEPRPPSGKVILAILSASLCLCLLRCLCRRLRADLPDPPDFPFPIVLETAAEMAAAIAAVFRVAAPFLVLDLFLT